MKPNIRQAKTCSPSQFGVAERRIAEPLSTREGNCFGLAHAHNGENPSGQRGRPLTGPPNRTGVVQEQKYARQTYSEYLRTDTLSTVATTATTSWPRGPVVYDNRNLQKCNAFPKKTLKITSRQTERAGHSLPFRGIPAPEPGARPCDPRHRLPPPSSWGSRNSSSRAPENEAA